MSRTVVIVVVVAICLGIYFLVDNIKNAYKLMPVQENPTMQVAPFADWREFTSDAEGFQVSLPAYPQHATQNVFIPNTNKRRKYDMYAAEKVNGSVFMISVITYPDDVKFPPNINILENAVQEMMDINPNNQLEKMEHSRFLNHDAVDFSIKNPDFQISGKAIQQGKAVYLLTYVAKIADVVPTEYQHFLDTFRFIDKTVPAAVPPPEPQAKR